ncbi:MAG: histidine kinase dimerization/phospho-acceptor domain-containing protein, partial [Pseudomonadota bacterium]
MLRTLYGKLSAALLLLVALLGVAFLFVVRFAADYYYEEITQRLNSSIVEYILQHEVLMQDGEPNLSDWKDLAHTVMIVNPTVEVYLLDAEGHLLAYDAPEEKIRRRQVDVGPIERFLAANAPMPTRGDDPRSDDARKLFAAAALEEDGELSGYVYAILSSERYQAVAQNLASGFMIRLSIIGVTASGVFAFLAGLLLFNLLTRRLRQLTRTVDAYRASDFTATTPPRLGRADGDEVDRLALAYSDMSARIIDQVNALKRLDELRRELVTNVSHDLRTPLAAMLGYIETLQLKQSELDQEGRQHYLEIARRHGEQLNRLVDQLFELSQLDSEQVGAKAEPFSLAELISDITQTYQLRAEASTVTLGADVD